MKKKGFTILELIVVIIILWLILWFSKNFLKTDRQAKIIFGETCVNYLFGEMKRFHNDIVYGKNLIGISPHGPRGPLGRIVSVASTISAQKTIPRTAITGGIRWSTFDQYILDESGRVTEQIVIFWIGGRWSFTGIPPACMSTKYTLAVQNLSGDDKWVSTDQGLFYWDYNINAIDKNVIYTESVINVCDSTTNWYLTYGSNCFEIAKLIRDKRQDDYFYLKCISSNPVTGICNQRPVVYP